MSAPDPTGPPPAVLTADDLVACWGRTLLVEPDGARDVTTSVTWLQGPTFYVDIRVREDGTVAEAFAGRLAVSGDRARWHRDIDINLPAEHPDEGTLVIEDGTLVERGVHAAYVEHWERRHPGSGSGGQVAGAARLTLADGSTGVVVRVGDHVGLALGPVDGRPVVAVGRCLDEAMLVTESSDADLLGLLVAVRGEPGGVTLPRAVTRAAHETWTIHSTQGEWWT